MVKDGLPMASLRYNEKDGSYIKGKRTRITALHQVLIDAGFLEFVEQQRIKSDRTSNRQLFAEFKSGPMNLLGARPSRFFRHYLDKIPVKDGADGYGAHSFRHTMTDAGYMDVEFGQIVLGHSNNSITSLYGSVAQDTPARLKEMLEKAFNAEPYKGVDFDRLRDGFQEAPE